jgi:hypothetical protein
MFIRAMVRIFSFGERWNVPFNSAVASLNGTFHLSPHENILTIARINIHYLYTLRTFQGHSRPCISIQQIQGLNSILVNTEKKTLEISTMSR